MSFKKFALVPYETHQQLTAEEGETEVPNPVNPIFKYVDYVSSKQKIGHCNF